ncbi:SDR family NAD(P)-dependent oxidoreductase [Desulfoluna sp.]|uniref:SDR family NAD(P)-dependent oxidoreductase n=1 Tax=Desulfoluna sp. TaxID=2045199 RepID=UPI002631D936|nr:SDR family NAD(P)-dependent oxidoreductase [Desulfoluna sp.]
MIELKETISVRRPIDDVFRYLSDFTNIEQWDPGVVRSVMVSQGPVQLGAAFELTLRYLFFPVRMIYTIAEYEAPYRVVLKGMGGSFSVTDTIELSGNGPQTQVTYTAAFVFSALSPRLVKMMKPALTLIGKASMAGMKKALSPIARPPQSVSLFSARSHPMDVAADRLILPGALGFSTWGHRLSKSFWRANAESLTRQTVVLTGATSGLGKAAALGLARRGAKLTFIARNREKALATQRELSQKTGNNHIDFYIADLGLMADIKKVAEAILHDKPSLDVLINNAGAMFAERSETVEGLEKTFATNLLGPFFLTRHLLEGLSRTKAPRIINVSSGGMYTQRVHVADLEMNHQAYDGATAYAWAKRSLVILTELWAEQLKQKNMSVHAMHPGWVDTPGLSTSLPRFHQQIRPLLRTPEQGADTLVWLASAMEPGQCSGLFWLDRRPHITHVFAGTRETDDERRQLWKALEAYEKKRLSMVKVGRESLPPAARG